LSVNRSPQQYFTFQFNLITGTVKNMLILGVYAAHFNNTLYSSIKIKGINLMPFQFIKMKN